LVALAALGALALAKHANDLEGSSRTPVLVRRAQGGTEFARSIERLSEPSRYFDTDNLISNERSYLHVIGKLGDLEVAGGGYIGVGPGQNFSYVAQIRPSVAFMIDIRRDNLLQHLMYKALFELSHTRVEYVCLWLARACSGNPRQWKDLSLEDLIDYIDSIPFDTAAARRTGARLRDTIERFGLLLTDDDLATIERFHIIFARAGLDLRFASHGRAPLPDYPTLRQLLLETDLDGRQAHYLASRDGFLFLKALQESDLVIPVVGDLAGDHALSAIGQELKDRGLRVSALYTSNVEYYLMREGIFTRFAGNVEQLPIDERSVIIRSYFNRGFRGRHPQSVPGYSSTQLLQTIESFVSDGPSDAPMSYWDLVTKHTIALQDGGAD
jgi:hypothetical protein